VDLDLLDNSRQEPEAITATSCVNDEQITDGYRYRLEPQTTEFSSFSSSVLQLIRFVTIVLHKPMLYLWVPEIRYYKVLVLHWFG